MYSHGIPMCSFFTYAFLLLVCYYKFLDKAEANEISTNLTHGRIRLYFFKSQFLGFAHNYAAPPDTVLESNCQRIGINTKSTENDYAFNILCFWKITVPTYFQVALTFQSFEMGSNDSCTLNYVEIRNGHSRKSPSLGKYCGSSIPDDIHSFDEKMSIELSLKSLTSKTGFSVNFFKMPCEKVINASSGVITSPSFPDRYPPNKHCTWEVVVPPRHYVVLNFTDFDLGNFNGTCVGDNLKLRSKMDAHAIEEHCSSRVLSPGTEFCGSRIPSSYIFNETFQIEFNSGSLTANKSGFSASFAMGENECLTDNGECQHFCDDTFEGYICSCKNGYTLGKNQHDCEDIEECITGNGGCEHLCDNVEGSYICSCESGYLLHENLHNCTDIDECIIDNGGCEQLCNNVGGNYVCSCESGYLLHENLHNCTDIDECITDNGGCEQLCNNVDGSYVCSCESGYLLHENLHNCTDIDECITDNGGCEQLCNNVDGSYVCSCESGYLSHENFHNCTDIDECITDNGGCEQLCNNVNGSYVCSCESGYLLHENLHNCTDACGDGVIEQQSGTIKSPLFPDLYPSNKNCIWEIIAPPQYRITLNFTHFDVEGNNQDCEYDSVDIRSKMANNQVLKHGVFCGSRLPPVIVSKENDLRIEFNSDKSVQKSGFSALFFTDEDECAVNNGGCHHICKNTIGSYACSCRGGFILLRNQHDCTVDTCAHQINSPTGVISSPRYPDYYPSRASCTWLFETTPGHRIILVFTEFEVEPHDNCIYDWVVLYNGGNDAAPASGKFCGYEVPHPYLSSGDQMYMIFKSDASVQRKGFKARYTAVCGGRLIANKIVYHFYSHAYYGDQNYESFMDCDWIIESENKVQHIHLSFLTFDVEHNQDCGYDYVEIFDGNHDSAPRLGRFCGNKIPPKFTSTGYTLLLRFRTDDAVNLKGFAAAYFADDSMDFEH